MMNRLVLGFAAIAAVSACSNTRERGVPVAEQPDRTLQVARPDSTDTTSSDKTSSEVASRSEQPVSQVEQQPTHAPKAKASRPARKPVVARAKPRVDTASARGYAPRGQADSAVQDASIRGTDSSQVAESIAAKPDTAAAARLKDTVAVASADTVVKRDTVVQRDTVVRRDTVVQRDTVVSRDTVDVARKDSVSTDSTPAATDSTARDRVASPAVASSGPGASSLDLEQRTLAVGTEIHAALNDSITSRHDTAGQSVTAEITQSVTGAGGKVLIPAGSTVRLTVVRLAAARSKSSQGRLRLKVDGIEMGGQVQSVQADLRPVPRELRGRGVTGSEAAKVGAGAAGGAVVGGVVGGSTKGAVIGGVIGAAGGAVVASQTATRDVVVKAKTPVTFVLTAPLVTR
jgi:hypothetical protein